MKKLFLPLLLLSVHAIAQDRMTPEMLWNLKRVSADELSKSGKTLYYTTKQYEIATEKSTTQYKKVNLETGLVSENTEAERQKRADKLEVEVMTTDNELLVRFAAKKEGTRYPIPGVETFKLSPDNKYVAFNKDVLVTPMNGKDIHADLTKTTMQVYTDLNYRHWDTWEDGKYSHLHILDIASGKWKNIMESMPYDCPQKPFGGAEDFVFTPDGKGIVYVCKKKVGKDYAQSTNTDIYYYDFESGSTTNWTQGMNGYDMAPAFSNDGKRMAWLSMSRDGFEADKNDICVMDLENHTRMNLTAGWDGTVEGFMWDKVSSRILFTAPTKGTQHLFQVDVPSNLMVKMMPHVAQITQGKFDVTGIVGISPLGVVVTRTDMNHATELYMVNMPNGTMDKLTHENDAVYSKVKLSRTELRMVPTSDNKEMGVWVIYPPDFNPKKKYPTLLYCQGGPQSALSQFYSFRWNFQLMAANGYIVIAPNRRGMPGWGVKWNEDISKDWGGQPMSDYLSAIDYMSHESYVDKDRLGCVGASYGGYSVFMLAGMHNDRFKSFIAHDGLFDLKSWYGTTEELWFANWDVGGSYWSRPLPESYTKFNPSYYVDKWNTPIMIIQGGTDYRVPIEQGLEAFQAAQLKGLKSKLLYFPNENHWILHCHNGIAWHREFYKWLSETIK